ncbi:prepilin peptidase [Methylolobus aquaticus]|nr:prepilin peptidase [Methylolobus aquaticus]
MMSEVQALPEAVVLVLAGVIGLLVGSFLNVVIFRLPRMLERGWRRDCQLYLGLEAAAETGPDINLLWPNSFCPACRAPIRPWENIPVISYLLLRGRCRACGARIPLRYPVIEALTAGIAVLVVWRFGASWPGLAALVLSGMLIALSAIDLEHQLLPDAINGPGLWLGLLLSLTGWFVEPRDAIIGAAAGYLALWGVYQLFRLATGKEGMGFGDFKLLALLGAWLGWQAIPVIVLISSTLGAVVGSAMILFAGHERGKPLPFGPYLAAAGFIHLCWGQALIDAYLGWFHAGF